MFRMKSALIALTLALAASAAYAQAPVQPPTQPYSPPVLNPYLNLLNRGNPAINYYGIVRPQIQQGQQLQMLQFGLNRTAAEAATAEQTALTAPGASAVLPDTGHVAGFMTQTKYFNTVNQRGR
jgi:hypothetical protein